MGRRTQALVVLLAGALGLAGCTVKDQEAPALQGPSELGLSLGLQATPDALSMDGASQSVITVTARDSNGQAVRSLPVRVEITVGGVLVDFGQLSAKNVVTSADGRATVTYTAPAAPAVTTDSYSGVTIIATPGGTDFRNAAPHQVDIRLYAPGVIVPPNDLQAGFSFLPTDPNESDTVVFKSVPCESDDETDCTRGSVSSYTWDFGDGGTGSGATTTHQFRLAGNYAVTLTVADSLSRAASATQMVPVGQGKAPTAEFVFSPTSPGINQDIFFNAAASQAGPGRTIVDYYWDFGSGTPRHGMTVTKSYDVPGTYVVTLTVTDDVGKKGVKSTGITISTSAPGAMKAEFTNVPTSPRAGQPVTFDATDSFGPNGIVAYEWEWGDSSAGSTGRIVQHTFAAAGQYIVRLTIVDPKGLKVSTSKTIYVGT